MIEAKEHKVRNCPICRSSRTEYAFSLSGAPVVRCADCNFLFLHPQPSDEVLRHIYTGIYFLGSTDASLHAHIDAQKTATAELYLDQLAGQGIHGGHLLDVGCGNGHLLAAAERRGYAVTGVEYSAYAAQRARAGLTRGHVLVGELAQVGLPIETFDVCVLADVIEHVRDPRSFMATVRERLKPGGRLLIATPTTDSWSARLMRRRWMEFKTEHMSYFSRRTLDSLLLQTGFRLIQVFPGYKIVSLRSVLAHFEAYPVPLWTSLVRFTFRWLPRRLLEKPRRLAGSGMLVLAIKDHTPSPS